MDNKNANYTVRVHSEGIPYIEEDTIFNITGNVSLADVEIIAAALAKKRYKNVKNNDSILDYVVMNGGLFDNYSSKADIFKDGEFEKEVVVKDNGQRKKKKNDFGEYEQSGVLR